MSKGLASLLNLNSHKPHCTVFLLEKPLEPSTTKRVLNNLKRIPTKVVYVSTHGGQTQIKKRLAKHGIHPSSHYVSFHCVVISFNALKSSLDVSNTFPDKDFSRIELPESHIYDNSSRSVRELFNVILRSDYGAQEKTCKTFYSLLALRKPYEVKIDTKQTLIIQDQQGWFQLAGKLVSGESRILPSGEVAYTGRNINGGFVVNGALLASPQGEAAIPLAKEFSELRNSIQVNPIRFWIENGRIVDVEGSGALYTKFKKIFQDDRYREVTEVGIGFNHACKPFIHHWPSSSNEAYPSVHIALGGDPVEKSGPAMVHIDLMTTGSKVNVNGHAFDFGAP